MTFFKKALAVLSIAPLLFTMPAMAAHPETSEKPTPQINAQSLDDLDFTDREIRIIREQIAAAQKRVDRAQSNEPTKTLTQQLNEIQLPSDAEIKQMQAQLPDLNRLMAGMMKLATDEEMKTNMAKSADRLKEKLDVENFETKDGLPDLNGMMAAMIALMGDEELIGDLIEAVEPIAEFMDDAATEVEKKAKD